MDCRKDRVHFGLSWLNIRPGEYEPWVILKRILFPIVCWKTQA